MEYQKERQIVVVNQAVNYLTIGFCNAFNKQVDHVALIAGNLHTQGEKLDDDISVTRTNKWIESPTWKKFGSYLVACIRIWWLLLTRYRQYEVVFISVPPMAYLLTLVLPNRCSMVIWDVYPDAFKVTGMKENNWLYRLWGKLNKKAFNKAFKLFTISERLADLLAEYVERKKIQIQPIWSLFQSNGRIEKRENPFIQQHQLQDYFIVQYSGNIGLSHNVEVLVELAETMKDHDHILFQIIGRGPRRKVLQDMVSNKNLANCQFLPFQSDDMFPYSLSAADVGVVILNDQVAKGSVPSKSFNIMSYGIPSLYVASPDSQLKVYTEKFSHGLCVAKDDLETAKQFLLDISKDSNKYQAYVENSLYAAAHFKRDNADKLVEKYLDHE